MQRRDFLKKHRFELSGAGRLLRLRRAVVDLQLRRRARLLPVGGLRPRGAGHAHADAVPPRGAVHRLRSADALPAERRLAGDRLAALVAHPRQVQVHRHHHHPRRSVRRRGRRAHRRSTTVLGLTWEAGAGAQALLQQYFAFRLDLRDFLLAAGGAGPRAHHQQRHRPRGAEPMARLALCARGRPLAGSRRRTLGARAPTTRRCRRRGRRSRRRRRRRRPPADAKAGADACIDENVKADLFAKRKQRTSRERLFQQTNRHELTAAGGYYVSDLFDGTYTVGGAYTYHMTEDLGGRGLGQLHAPHLLGRARAGADLRRAAGQAAQRAGLRRRSGLGRRRTPRCASAARSPTSTSTWRAGGGVVDSVALRGPGRQRRLRPQVLPRPRLGDPLRRARPRLPAAAALGGDVGQRPDHHRRAEPLPPDHGVTHEAARSLAFLSALALALLALPAPAAARRQPRKNDPSAEATPDAGRPADKSRGARARRRGTSSGNGASETGAAPPRRADRSGQAARRIRSAARRAVPRPGPRRAGRGGDLRLQAGGHAALEGGARLHPPPRRDPPRRQRRSGTRAKSRWSTS